MSGYRTLISLVVALMGELLRMVGVEIGPQDQEGLVNAVMVVGGIGAAIYFRITAKRRVGSEGKLS